VGLFFVPLCYFLLDISNETKPKVHRKSLTINDLRRGAARRAKSLVPSDLRSLRGADFVPTRELKKLCKHSKKPLTRNQQREKLKAGQDRPANK
jgi:hypothetical protein